MLDSIWCVRALDTETKHVVWGCALASIQCLGSSALTYPSIYICKHVFILCLICVMVRALPRPSYWLGIPPTGQSLDGEDLWTAIKDAAGFRLFWIKSKTCDLADLACSCSGLCSNSLLGFSLAPSCGACTMSGCNTVNTEKVKQLLWAVSSKQRLRQGTEDSLHWARERIWWAVVTDEIVWACLCWYLMSLSELAYAEGHWWNRMWGLWR